MEIFFFLSFVLYKKKLQRVFAISLAVALTIPQVSLEAEAAGEKGYYLNAYAPVRGIEVGEKAEISAYAKDRVSNERVEEAIAYNLLLESVDTANVLESQFKAVYERYQGESNIAAITVPEVESEDDSVVAVKVELKNGRVDYLYFSEMGSAAILDGKIVDGTDLAQRFKIYLL